jgi:hypothetical protein
MKITVYFEAPAGAHEVAVFFDELLYVACVPTLEERATAQGYVLSESVTYEEEEENQEIDLDGGVSAINEQQEESEE